MIYINVQILITLLKIAIQDLKNIIKNKPDFKIEAGEIIQGAMSIVETKTTKNSIYSNRYIVK